MTIILFLVDTSSSMCQKAYVNGVQKSYLDIAKGAVETFLKYRQRTQDCLGDRYMLLTFEEPPANVKAGWKENHATFMNELKNLQSNGLTSMGESLKNAFDLLNLNRMQSGIDTYGQGRCPFYLEPSVIIVITDGGRYSYRNGVHQEIILPLNTQIPGTKFTKEPFRWDQRLFSLVLRMSGNKIDERVEGKVPHDDSPIERMCEVTGGRSYRVRSHYVLNQCIESLVQKVQPGVVLQFEPMLPKDGASSSSSGASGAGLPNETVQDIVFQPTKKMIYVQKHIAQKTFPIGYWPLPEPYWPDPKAVTLPPRDAHPKLKIATPAVDEPQMVRSFPVDKYEIEASPLTLQILNKREMNKCWQVIISNGMHGFELPFGYLKATPSFSQVHLYVLAYNYPALLPLLHDLIHKYNMNPPNDLMYKFNAYVRSIPPYYCPFLRKALVNISVPYQLLQFLLPDNVDNYLSPNIANQLKHIKNTAKQDQENLCMKVYKQLKQPKPPYRQVETAKLNTGVSLRRDLVRNPLLRDTFAKLHTDIEPVENYTIVVPQITRQASAKSYRNPFDIPRRDLIEEIARMRETFLRPAPTSLVAKDSGHCLPISEMGNYQEYLKSRDNPLREIEPTNVRQHMFGNPYKKDKHMVMVDEADLSDVAPMKASSSNGGGGMPHGAVGVGGMSGSGMPGGILMGVSKKLESTRSSRKRKAGPIPRSFEFRRTSIDVRPSCSGSVSSKCSTSSNSSGISCSSPKSSGCDTSDMDDDDMNSETESICSVDSSSNMSVDGCDNDRIGCGFDFNEEESNEQDTALNGYVHNFINGINEETNSDVEMVTQPSTSAVAPVTAAVLATTAVSSTAATAPAVALAAPTTTTIPTTTTANTVNSISSIISNIDSSIITTTSTTSTSFTSATPSLSSCTSTLSSAPTCSNIYSTMTMNGLVHPPPTYGGYAPQSVLLTPVTDPMNSSLSAALSASNYNKTTTNCNGYYNHVNHVTAATSAAALATSMPSSLSSSSTISSNLNAATVSTAAVSSTTANPSASTSAAASTSAGTSSTTSLYYSHNDINDAQEISRILQTCHNGGNGSSSSKDLSSTSSSISSSNNNNGSSSSNYNENSNKSDIEKSIMPPPLATSASSSSTSSANCLSLSSLTHNTNASNACASPSAFVAANVFSSSLSSAAATAMSLSSSFDSLKRDAIKTTNHHWLTNGNSTTHPFNHTTNNNSISNHLKQNNHQQQQQSHDQQLPKTPITPSYATSPTQVTALLTDEQRDAARKHNLEIRGQIFRDIRKPGRNYAELLEHLNLIKGDFDIQSNFIEMCISESLRFRRKQMVYCIREWWERKQEQLQTAKS